jgi:molybdenum cofactor biosynthesis enzyme MoaA
MVGKGRRKARTVCQREGESSIGVIDGLTDQFCSSCNQKKPLIDFGCFFICNDY